MDYYVEARDSLGLVKRSPIQHVWVGTGEAPQDTTVYWEPSSPSPGDSVTIYYDPVAGALPDLTDPVYIHIGHSGWQEIVNPDPTMVFEDSIGYWSYTYLIPSYATSVDFCFNDGQGNWDNNQGNDWHIQLGGGVYQMDGQLDEVVEPLAVNGSDTLWADRNESQLYLATNVESGSDDDRFIFLALSPGPMVDAPWLKSGKVASFDAYLAREGENGWTGWFENQGAALSAGGSVLEGWIDLQGEFGFLPDTVYLALGIYQTPDNGCLIGQVPPSLDGDGDIDGNEYISYPHGVGVNSDPTLKNLSLSFGLGPNYPNPFNSLTTICYTVPSTGQLSLVTLKVYNIKGQLVKKLVEKEQESGRYTITWDGRDERGNKLASGVYLYQLRIGGRSETRRMLYLK